LTVELRILGNRHGVDQIGYEADTGERDDQQVPVNVNSGRV
jgi:hypothetical protein